MRFAVSNRLTLAILVGALACSSATEPSHGASDTFTGVTFLRINQAQGETRVSAANGDAVSVQYHHTYPESCHHPEFTQTSDTLDIRGVFTPVACSGRAEIEVWVPTGVAIDYSGSQADLLLDNVAVAVTGYASSIRAEGLLLTGASSIRANHGNLEVSLGHAPDHDLDLFADGDVVLGTGGNQLHGRFEFAVREGSGQIVSPFPFDEEISYDCQCEPGVTWWVRMTFTLEAALPLVRLSTRDGRAELRLN